MRSARQQCGLGYLGQLRDLMRLRFSRNTLGATDYYWYRLFDKDYLAGELVEKFAGWRIQQALSEALNPRCGVLPAWDKLVFHTLAHSSALPVCEMQAVYLDKNMTAPDWVPLVLRSKEDLCAFLTENASFPVFGKPSFSQQGYGGVLISSFDQSNETLRLYDGATLTLPEFLRKVIDGTDARFYKRECGYMFQSAIKQHAEISTLTGTKAASGLRIVMLNVEGATHIVRALWKIVVGNNISDNFSLGTKGNLVADVDVVTGVVSHALDALGPDAVFYDSHPETGRPIKGWSIPLWESVTDVCHRAAAAFPLMRLQHWDVVIGHDGPILLEVNDLGATEFCQLHGKGLLTDEVRAALRSYADPATHPWTLHL